MKLKIKNVGILSKVDLEINGITVIAGENDTGKSTISKSLYAIFNGFYRINDEVFDLKMDSIADSIDDFLEKNFSLHLGKSYKKKNENIELLLKNKKEINEESIKKILIEIVNVTGKKNNLLGKPQYTIKSLEQKDLNISVDELIAKINSIKEIDNTKVVNRLLETNFNREFSNQINNINTNETSNIVLNVKDMEFNIEIKDGHLNLKKRENSGEIYTRAVYIDDPLILDKESERNPLFSSSIEENSYFHSDNLVYDLQRKSELNLIEEIQINEKIRNIFSKINKKGIGKLSFKRDMFKSTITYKPSKDSKVLDIRNVSAGLKSFLIIKTLLENGILKEKGVIILDEPEIHLHPEWQVLFAELIVLIQKEFNMHILLTTHSPYFLYAIELFTKKYEINEKCKVYFSEKENEKTTLKDVTENTEVIFRSLSNPFFKLEDMEVKMEEENCEK